MICTVCNYGMNPLFTSWYCPNSCESKPVAVPVAAHVPQFGPSGAPISEFYITTYRYPFGTLMAAQHGKFTVPEPVIDDYCGEVGCARRIWAKRGVYLDALSMRTFSNVIGYVVVCGSKVPGIPFIAECTTADLRNEMITLLKTISATNHLRYYKHP